MGRFHVGLHRDGKWLRLKIRLEQQILYLYLGLEDSKTNRQKAAKLKLQIEAELENGTFDLTLARYKPHAEFNKPIANLTGFELLEDWMVYKSTHCCSRTVEWYQAIKQDVYEVFPDKPASELTKADAIAFLSWLQEKPIKPYTKRRKLEALTACWAWGIENGYLTENPWIGLGRLIRQHSKPMPQPFTLDEIGKIIKGFEESDRYSDLTPFVRFLLGTGVRTGEAIGLKWKDINLKTGLVTIGGQLTRGQFKETKTGKPRSFKLSASLHELLQRHATRYSGMDYVFTRNGRPINLHNFRGRVWKPILRAAMIPYRSPYHCRCTFISHALEKGYSPATIAQMTGHNVQTLFKHYAGSLQRQPKLPDIFDEL